MTDNPLAALRTILESSASRIGGPDPLTAVEDADGLVHLVNPAGVPMLSMSGAAYEAFQKRALLAEPNQATATPTEPLK